MSLSGALPANAAGTWWYLALVAACFLLAASLIACSGGGSSVSSDERVLGLEAKAHSLEESLEAVQDENAKLNEELASLKQAQAEFVEAREAAEAAREHEEEVADFEEVQEGQLSALEEGQTRTDERLDNLDSRLRDMEDIASRVESVLPLLGEWLKSTDKTSTKPEGSVIERTRQLAEAAGGEVYNIDSREPEERAILVMPLDPIDGNPLIVSLHGYGGNSLFQSMYMPLHERVNDAGFGLLLANGTMDAEGNRSWNPTDQISSSSKASADDYAYLAGLVERALEVKDFGPVYFFGYSNGGFMAYHMACKGLPDLRAVASLAGTSYVEDSECDGARPVSVLHIHGTDDDVVLFEGEVAEPVSEGESDSPFYASVQEMMMRWSQRAGCEWPEVHQNYATFDFDQHVPGSETNAFLIGTGCAEGIEMELWTGLESGHAPGYGDAFVDALLDWLLSQE